MTGNKHPSIETHIIVIGTVQGVFFRAKTKDLAESLGLKGYIQNLSDGSVEICIAGEEIDSLLDALKKEPPPIQISKIKISKHPSTQIYENFMIIT